MAARFKKPITREVDLPVWVEGMSSAQDMPHVLTFDNVGVVIRRKNSKAVNFVEWRIILRNCGGIALSQEDAEAMRELRRKEYCQDGGPKKAVKKKPEPRKEEVEEAKPQVAGIDRTQVALEGEPGPNSPPEDLEEYETLFEELGGSEE